MVRMAGFEHASDDSVAFGAWLEREFDRLAARAERLVPASPSPNPDADALKVIARACGRYELAFAAAPLHANDHRKLEVLGLMVLGLARVYGREFKDAAEARAEVQALYEDALDEGKVKAALGAAGAFAAPLLSPDIAAKAWRLFLRVPPWGKIAAAGGLVALLLAVPMLKPLSLGIITRERFSDARSVALTP